MNINFKSIELCNFLSFGSASVTLSDQGYVLVKGINNNPTDNARSNGAGKTTIFNAICWALTGQTLYGMRSNIVNINAEDGCYVKLEFSSDGSEYTLLRSKDHSEYKTDLKIYVDGKDVSGKGIRDSEKLLSQFLPDLTPQLLGSVILLGQGLPQRFTNNTPSGRKEVLEKLSKSDFMIEDIKEKLSNRKTILSDDVRQYEDAILKLSTQKTSKEEFITSLTQQIQQKDTYDNLVTELANCLPSIEAKSAEVNKLSEEERNNTTSVTALRDQQAQLQKEFNTQLEQFLEESNMLEKQLNDELRPVEVELSLKKRELTKLSSIVDVCPTCGQRIPGAMKPDTTQLCSEIELLEKSAKEKSNELQSLKNTNLSKKTSLQESYKKSSNQLSTEESEAVKLLKDSSDKLAQAKSELESLTRKKTLLESQIEMFEQKQLEIKNNINLLTSEIKQIEDKILYNNMMKEEFSTRLSYVTKMTTIATRDFRGFLLSNIIEYIDSCAKNYARYIFDNDKISFALSGNNLDISYDGKIYESLSSGEKQKIDIIIQLSLRDMLCKYMNFRCNILALDEVFDGLDGLGCERIVNLINNITDIESVFIITHHTNDIELSYDYELTVVKNSTGISEII